MDARTAIREIEKHVSDRGGAYRDWYVGVASDPRERLFTQHKVREKGGHWIHRELDSADEARSVEKYFLEKGMDGGAGGGDESSKHVYAYRKTADTDP